MGFIAMDGNDIVYRLKRSPGSYVCIRREAAQEIDRLRKIIERLIEFEPSPYRTASEWLAHDSAVKAMKEWKP